MKVIMAGLSKTGTKSMNAALTELGYNVHDFMESFQFAEKEWKEILTTGGSTELLRKMYENVDAVTDLPGCVFWDEILKAFPDAKVILTLRDSEDDWYQSMLVQMKSNMSNVVNLISPLTPTGRRLNAHSRRIVLAGFGHDIAETYVLNETVCKMKYRRHNAHVIQNAPKDQLLIFNVKEGWDPLCQFLGLPTPDKPFPHKNKGGSIVEEFVDTQPVFIRLKREAMVSIGVLAVLTAFGLYKGVKFARGYNWSDKLASIAQYISR